MMTSHENQELLRVEYFSSKNVALAYCRNTLPAWKFFFCYAMYIHTGLTTTLCCRARKHDFSRQIRFISDLDLKLAEHESIHKL